MGKLILAGLVAGVVMFAWGAVSHLLLPLGDMGVKGLPNEGALVAQMTGSIDASGAYLFPYVDMEDATEAEMDAWNARAAAGPTGMLVYRRGGNAPFATMLTKQLCIDILGALLVAFVLLRVGGGFGTRVVCAGVMGLFATITINAPYWNWYSFPGDFTVSSMIDSTVGWLIAGVVLAKLLPSD